MRIDEALCYGEGDGAEPTKSRNELVSEICTKYGGTLLELPNTGPGTTYLTVPQLNDDEDPPILLVGVTGIAKGSCSWSVSSATLLDLFKSGKA
jgi:hypothetical protein